ncbi:MAG: UPF0175 family protein [Leptolyngbyaceae bacterium]|nr:UPF0175 family protein [Leptolyngbyaceae bacterium]
MSLQLTIPDSVVNQLHIPAHNIQAELTKQLAVSLYAKGMISFDAACDLAGKGCWEFGQLVNEKDLAKRCGRVDADGEVFYRCSE